MNTLLLTIFALLPFAPEPTRDRCDYVEVNHYLDADLKETFTQTIFWDVDLAGDKRCVAFRIFRDEPRHRERDAQGWRWSWLDHGRFREVRAASWFESWSTYDPEQRNRSELPMNRRRGLSE